MEMQVAVAIILNSRPVFTSFIHTYFACTAAVIGEPPVFKWRAKSSFLATRQE